MLRLKRTVQIFFAISITFFIFTYLRLPSTVNEGIKLSADQNAKCAPRTSLVFIKMIKCASSSISNVIRKFGYTKNLSFVLPLPGRIYIGWPYRIQSSLYRAAKNSKFNLLCEHSVLDRRYMEEIMVGGRETLFVTSLREPFSQFKSTLNYYNVLNISRVPMRGDVWRFLEYVDNIQKYEKIYKSHETREKRYCIPDGLSMTKNLMSFNLGLQTGFNDTADLSDNILYVKKWLADLAGSLDLVIIYEHLYESLVLLSRLTCWELRDLILPMYNRLSYRYRDVSDVSLEEKYKKWSAVDYMLYDYFKAILLKKISQQSDDFNLEVAQLKKKKVPTATLR